MDFKIEDKIDIKELFDNEEELVISYKYKDKIEFQKEEALSLGNTYEDWVNEEENKYYRREQKKNDSINFLKKYYPELLK